MFNALILIVIFMISEIFTDFYAGRIKPGKANDDEEPLNVSAHLKPEYDIGQVIQRKYISSLLFVAFGFPLGF